MTPLSPSKALAKLQQLQKEHEDPKKQLAILRISEPIASASDVEVPNRSPSKRSSDVSADPYENPTPASLEADLTHYKVCGPLYPRRNTHDVIDQWLTFGCSFSCRSYSPNCASPTLSR